MLDVKRALASLKLPERINLRDLTTPWGEELLEGGAASVLPEYPRPALRRPGCTMLNGYWDYAVTSCPAFSSAEEALEAMERAAAPSESAGRILVPFSPEAALSGVGRTITPEELLWYRRRVEAPACSEHERVILHFEAVDWVCTLWVNGVRAAAHQGGYLPFDVDVTPYLAGGALDILLCVYDPSDAGAQPRGKQTLHPGGMWYAAQSGIWQPVWYEVVPAVHVSRLTVQGDAEGTCRVEAAVSDPTGLMARPGARTTFTVAIIDGRGARVAQASLPVAPAPGGGAAEVSTVLVLEHPRLWSPDDPCLYRVETAVETATDATDADGAPDALVDAVTGYCAFRSVAIARGADGAARLLLNGEPLFLRGVLEQGYWPDGLMTAPSDDALAFDIAAMRDAGFNMLRVHTKIERRRFYYLCDKMGMLVWQDAVIGGGPAFDSVWVSKLPTAVKCTWGAFPDTTEAMQERLSATDPGYRAEWLDLVRGMVGLLGQHPSIITWSLFNEAYGQFDAASVADLVHGLDLTRPIDAVSGWFDQRSGDYLSQHNYFRPLTVDRDRGRLQGYVAERGYRAVVLSEFGGWAQGTPGHTLSDGAYGYGNFPAPAQWRAFVRGQIAAADALEARGLAGYVYTQVSDVEDELNGLLTYDRRVNKLDPAPDA